MFAAIGTDDMLKYLLRDNDAIYGNMFRQKVAAPGLVQVTIARRSPWQKPYVERLIGPIRRECLGHPIIVGKRHCGVLHHEYRRKAAKINSNNNACGSSKAESCQISNAWMKSRKDNSRDERSQAIYLDFESKNHSRRNDEWYGKQNK